MREFRGWFTGSPRQAGRQGELGNVLGRVYVRVQPCSACWTEEAMSLPLSDFPTHAACLRRVSGVDVDYAQPGAFCLVGDKTLKLTKCPAMQARPDPLSCFDIGRN